MTDCTKWKLIVGVLFLSCGLLIAVAPTRVSAQIASATYPVIYSTDLYYTFIMDNDDPFDAAVLLKSPELEIKGVILDNHTYPSDGEKILEKLMTIRIGVSHTSKVSANLKCGRQQTRDCMPPTRKA